MPGKGEIEALLADLREAAAARDVMRQRLAGQVSMMDTMITKARRLGVPWKVIADEANMSEVAARKAVAR